MKLLLPRCAYLFILLLLFSPHTIVAAIAQFLNVQGKDNIDESYHVLHPGHDAEKEDVAVAPVPVPTAPFVIAPPVNNVSTVPNGIWTSYGYGLAMNSTRSINNSLEINVYQESNISCIRVSSRPYRVNWRWIGDNNSLIKANGIFFNLTKTFQYGCSKGRTVTVDDIDLYVRDPLYDYDIMVHWFQQLYPLFELKNIDWNKSTQEARLLLRSNSSDSELWETMTKVLLPLDDYFVWMVNPADNTSYFSSKMLELYSILEKEAKDIGEADAKSYSYQQLKMMFVDKIATYMKDSKLFDLATVIKGSTDFKLLPYFYGQIKGTAIGYMSILRFDQSFDFDSDAVTIRPNAEDFDLIFQTFQNMSSMIVDVRYNEGGYDSVALLLASYFSSKRQLAWTTRTRQYHIDDGLMDADSYYLNSSLLHFTGPVVVMMSESTGLSGESFILAMSSLSQVTFLGKQTSGSSGMGSSVSLPNGWKVGILDEVMMSPNGTIYQGRGLSPDIIPDTDTFALDERRSSTDAWLEMAIKYLNNTNSTNTSMDIANSTNTSTNITTIPEATSSSAEGKNTFNSYFHLMRLVIILIVTFTSWHLV